MIRFAKADKDSSNLYNQNLRTHQIRKIKGICSAFPVNQIYLFQAKCVLPPPFQIGLLHVGHSLFLSRKEIL